MQRRRQGLAHDSHIGNNGKRYDLKKRLKKFGLTVEWWDANATHCGICKTTKRPTKHDWHLDHDHRCCKEGCPKCFRGILCSHCNAGLGYFKDDPKSLQAAIAWVTRLF